MSAKNGVLVEKQTPIITLDRYSKVGRSLIRLNSESKEYYDYDNYIALYGQLYERSYFSVRP